MKAWRVFLAVVMIAASNFGVFYVTLHFVKNPIIGIALFSCAFVIGLYALSFAQDDGRTRKGK